MKIVSLGELMPQSIPSIDPARYPDEIFELWSIPSFDVGRPEILKGSSIGSSKKCVEPNDVLLSRIIPHIRRSWVVNSNEKKYRQIASGEWITFRNKRFYPPYLRQFLVSDLFHNEFMQTVAGVGGSLLRARPEGVKAIKIPFPPLEEQKRIAAILDQADALRRLRQRAIDRLNTLGQAIFYEMFGGEYTQKCNNSLGDFVEDFRYGTSNKSNEIGYPALRIPNVIDGKIEISDLKMVPVTNAELDRLRLQDGDLLFVRTNGNPDYVGRSAVFDPKIVADTGFDQNDWIYASYLIRGRLKNKKLHPVFLHKFLSTPQGRLSLRKKCRTSAGQFNINIDGLSSIPIILPEFDKQTIFVQRTNEMEKKIKLYEISKNRLDALFYSLQHRAFRGEL